MNKLFLAISISLLTGCAVTPVEVTPTPVDGSKSDGVIIMGYHEYFTSYEPTETFVNWAESQRLAKERCKVWGFKDAERFGDFVTQKCQKYTEELLGTFCSVNSVKIKYQCIN